jgi:hypothetical protein
MELMGNDALRSEMSRACRDISNLDAAAQIAGRISGEQP